MNGAFYSNPTFSNQTDLETENKQSLFIDIVTELINKEIIINTNDKEWKGKLINLGKDYLTIRKDNTSTIIKIDTITCIETN